VKDVAAFWEAMGARVSMLDPLTHDRVVAAISHLPHLVAYALVDGAQRFEPGALDFAARGFRDTTRIAASDPVLWQEIFAANRTPLLASLASFRDAVTEIERLVEAGDARALQQWLARVRAVREALG
jgi:prephenate dehydrogenase